MLGLPAANLPTVSEQIPLHPHAIDLADQHATLAAITRETATLHGHGIVLGSQLPALIAAADHQRDAMRTIVAIAAIQLVLLAVWVLAGQLVRSGDARRAEARVARLRGFSPGSLLWVTAAEPGVLCALGAVLGVALAWAVVLAVRASLLVAGSAIVFDTPTVLALGLVLLAIVAALGLGTLRLLRGAELAPGATRSSPAVSSVGLAVDAVLVVLAIVALVALGTTGALQGHTDPVAAAAPGLIALGTAVLAYQIILLACRLGVARTTGSRRVAGFLALRQTVRRPGVLRQARVLVIALGLACFATAAWSLARTNRSTVARFQVGADRVVSVAPVSPARLQQAVAKIDPRGRDAMAAIEERTSSTTLLAVDAARLPAIAAWPHGITRERVAELARRLAPASAPVVNLPGGRLRLTASTGGSTIGRLREVALAAWVFSPSGGTSIVSLGPLRAGDATYSASLAAECPGGCRLTGLGLVPASAGASPAAGSVRVRVSALAGAHPGSTIAADLRPSGWRASSAGVGLEPDGLTFTASAAAIAADSGASGTSTAPMVSVADRPRTIPGVATAELEQINSSGSGPLPTEGLDGDPIGIAATASATALPRVGADALLVDLPLLARAQVGPTSPYITDEVWLGSRTPAHVLARLRAAGLHPTAVASSAQVFAALQRTAPALADDFLLFAAIAALLVAAASTLGALGATTRERATELTSLHVAGVGRPALARALGLETVILLLTAVCGAGAGVLAARLAVPSLPELVTAQLAPLSDALPPLPIVIVSLTVIAAVALASSAVGAVLFARMSPALLRTAPDDVSG